MVSANLVLEARRRAGLSQRELAARLGVAQPTIARLERGREQPSFERLRTVIAACGLELTVAITRADDSYDDAIIQALSLSPAQRLSQALRDAQAPAAARARRSQTHEHHPRPYDVLAALTASGARFVLIGELAEVLHGSPLLPLAGSVAITPRPGEHDALESVIAAAGGRRLPSKDTHSVDAATRWDLQQYDTELVIDPAPPGTYGYEDLRRDAGELTLARDVVVPVASLVDLVRIAQASTDRARVPALRRTLELATTAPSATAADAA